MICKICSKELKSKGKTGLCSSCWAKERFKDPTNNPMYGKRHSNREVFRKNTYNNVNYDDRIVEYSSAGNSRKKYRMTCSQCGSDRGYQTNKDATRVCKQCRDKNVTCYTEEQKRLKCSMKANLTAKLKQRLINKCQKPTFDVLDYSVDDLIKHLESLFKPGMSWDNYGDWEIDHVTPDSWFSYNSFDDQGFKDSWKLSNLQPLWWNDNCSKGNRYQG